MRRKRNILVKHYAQVFDRMGAENRGTHELYLYARHCAKILTRSNNYQLRFVSVNFYAVFPAPQ